MDFGRPNAEIGWKMANGRLLFLALGVYFLSCIAHPQAFEQVGHCTVKIF